MKKLTIFLFSLFFLLTTTYATDLDITAKFISLYNLNDNELIYSKNADEKTSIASLTKIMTTLVAIENIDNLDANVTITSKDFEGTTGYSKAGFTIGDKVTYLDLLYGILLPSGADAVNAIVDNTLGYDNFIAKMNEKAKELNMSNTSFENPIGKDNEKNYSTAQDLSKLLRYALKNPTFKKIFTTKKYTTTNNKVLNSTINSYPDLDTSIINGAKSGFTKNAGRCLASISNLNNVNYLLIVISSDKTYSYNAIKDTLTIYNYYSDNYSYKNILNDETFIKEIPIDLSREKTYKITGNEEINKYLKNDSKIKYEYSGVDKITFNTKKGTKLGEVKIYNEDTLIATSNVYLENNITYYNIGYILILILIFIIIVLLRKNKKRKRRRRK